MVQDVAQWIGAPGPYLSKVFHALGKARLVDTKRGRKGGVILVAAVTDALRHRVREVSLICHCRRPGYGARPRCSGIRFEPGGAERTANPTSKEPR